MHARWFEFDLENEKIGILVPGKMPLIITKKDLDISFFSSGKGGQNLNRHMNGVRLTYTIPSSHQLPFKRTKMLQVKCNDQRHQEANFKGAFKQLAEKLEEYFSVPLARKKTSVPKSSKNKRIKGKKMRGEIKRERGPVDF